MADYRYPDDDDRIQNHLLEALGPRYAAYYRASERALLDRFRERFVGSGGRLLDAGTGTGRLLGTFDFARVLAVEPDPGRLDEARRTALERGLSKVEFVGAAIEEVEADEPFDAALCSHVVQHVATAQVPAILGRLHGLLRPGGRLLLTTCHSTAGQPVYDVTVQRPDGPANYPVPRAEFDRVASRAQPGVLGAHFFTCQEIGEAVVAAGFRVLELRTFHVDDLRFASLGLDALDDPDGFVNADPERQESLGVDLGLLAVRE